MAFVLGLAAGLVSLASTSVLLTLGFRERSPLLRQGGWLVLSLGLFQVSLLLAPGPLPHLATLLGGLAFLTWAPPFFHRFLGLTRGPWHYLVQGGVWGAYLVLAIRDLTLGSGAESASAFLNPLLPGLYAAVVAWGLGLTVWRVFIARSVAPLTGRFLVRFMLVAGLALPFIVLDNLGSLAGWTWIGLFDNLSLPIFLVTLTGLILVESRRWTLPTPTVSVEGPAGFEDLSPREKEIARAILEGASAKEIAQALDLSPKTVENHTYRIYQKLGVRSRLQFYHRVRGDAPVSPHGESD